MNSTSCYVFKMPAVKISPAIALVLHILLVLGRDLVFLEEPAFPSVLIGEQVQLMCRVLERYKIEWGIHLTNLDQLISTDQPQVLNTFKKRGIAVKRPNETTSYLVINTTETKDKIAAITCIAVNTEDPTIRYGSKEVKVNFGDSNSNHPYIESATPVKNPEKIMLLFAIIILVMILLFFKRLKKQTAIRNKSKMDVEQAPDQTSLSLVPQTPVVLPYNVIETLESNSEFSNDFKVVQPCEILEFSSRIIIVEILKDPTNLSIAEQMKFHEEKLIELRHYNVVRFYGVYKDNDPPFVMQEFVAMGSLNKYLRRNQEKMKSTKKMIKMCADLANGLKYISQNNLVHGKISSKSCVVDKGSVVKLCDFSMCIILHKRNHKFPDYVRKTALIRWWAVECFEEDSVATVKTDVWAFGVTMWEIFTLCGQKPFQGMKPEVEIKNQKLLPKPQNCSDDVYELMKSCWNPDPSRRHDFEHLHKELAI